MRNYKNSDELENAENYKSNVSNGYSENTSTSRLLFPTYISTPR
jgi:hypothetical protein